MARLAGVDLPRNKRMVIALTYIYGIGPTRSAKILEACGISQDLRTDDLTDDDIKKLFDSDNEILICEAAAALKSLNKLDGVDKIKLLDKIHDDNKKALIQSMFAG